MAFHTVAHTCNPIHVHVYSWTIENVSRIIELLSGPSFSPIPNKQVEPVVTTRDRYGNIVPTTQSNPSEVFRFDLSVKEFDHKLSADYLVEVYLHIKAINRTFNFVCDVTLCNADDKILTSAKIQFKKVEENASSLNKVLFTHLKKSSEEFEFLDLPDDKLILKARFSFSGYDKKPEISTPKITPSPAGYDGLSKDFKTMFESGFAHDVTFCVGGKTIPVHRAIVCSRSPVFAKMLEHDMLEKKSKRIVIEDADFEVFNYFLLYLYTGKVEEKNWETVITLYSLADKYEVESLRKECSEILTESLAISSVSRVLVLADLHRDEELKESVKVFFRGNFTRVIETSEWAKIVETNPQLASEVLESIKEKEKAA